MIDYRNAHVFKGQVRWMPALFFLYFFLIALIFYLTSRCLWLLKGFPCIHSGQSLRGLYLGRLEDPPQRTANRNSWAISWHSDCWNKEKTRFKESSDHTFSQVARKKEIFMSENCKVIFGQCVQLLGGCCLFLV